MKLHHLLLVLLTITLGVNRLWAKDNIYTVSYKSFSNSQPVPNSDFNMLFTNGVAYLTAAEANPASFIDYNRRLNVSIIKNEGVAYKTITSFDSLPKYVDGTASEKILGYACKHVVYKSFSNTIDIWFTEDSKAKGSPYSRFLPSENALVLKVSINNTRSIIAQSAEKIKDADIPAYNFKSAQAITQAEYEELRIKSRYTTLQVFNDEIVNFEGDLNPPSADQLENDRVYRFSKGTVIMRKITLPQEAQNGYIFARLNCRSSGDAYDRTGSVFAIPESDNMQTMLDALINGTELLPTFSDKYGDEYQGFVRTNNYEPPIELMRFFTSFGASHFNTLRVINGYEWQDDVVYKQDVSQVFPRNHDEVWIGIFIGNYSKEGHRVSLALDIYPSFEKEEKNLKKFVQPLFQTVNIMEMSGQNYPRFFDTDTLKITFEIDENTSDLQLIFITTGHGGWGGGDEFNPKLNQVFIDDEVVYAVKPWRTDCATYRLSNPASGNFGNGLSSSDLSRSNWCPATLTPPFIIPIKNLSPGLHILKVAIAQSGAEGNSFSHWGVSGTLTGKIKAVD